MNTPQLPMINPRARSHQITSTRKIDSNHNISTPTMSLMQMEKQGQNSMSYDQNLNKFGKRKKKRSIKNVMDPEIQFILEKGQISNNYFKKSALMLKKSDNYNDLDPDNIFEQC